MWDSIEVTEHLAQSSGLSNEFNPLPDQIQGEQFKLDRDRLYLTDGINKAYQEKLVEKTEQLYEYLSITRGLETSGERVDVLQNYVDQMLEGTGDKGQVVIMNRGQEADAFVSADGTIFISQALINKLSSLDRIVGVLAHEVAHILNRTLNKRIKAGLVESIGVSWGHEAVGDLLTIQLCAKVGINSHAFEYAIEELDDDGRDIAHMSNGMRGVGGQAMHGAIHFDTSTKPETPKPDILHREPTPTLIESIAQITKDNDIEAFTQALSQVHPRDLPRLIARFDNDQLILKRKSLPLPGESAEEVRSITSEHRQFQQVMYKELIRRMDTLGFEPYEIKLVFIAQGLDIIHRDEFTKVVKLEETLSMLDNIAENSFMERGEDPELFAKIHNLYGNQGSLSRHNFQNELIEYFQYHVGSPTNTRWDNKNVIFEEDEIVTLVSKLATTTFEFHQASRREYKNTALHILYRSCCTYLANGQEPATAVEKMQQLATKCKAAGVQFSAKEIKEHYQSGLYELSYDEEQQVKQVLRNTFTEKSHFSEAERIDQRIDICFSQYNQEQNTRLRAMYIQDMLTETTALCYETRMDNEARYNVAQKITRHIMTAQSPLEVDPIAEVADAKLFLQRGYTFPVYGDHEKTTINQSNKELNQIQLKLLTAITIFKEDDGWFYRYLNEICSTHQSILTTLTYTQKVNLFAPILFGNNASEICSLDSNYVLHFPEVSRFEYSNYETIAKIPVIAQLLREQPAFQTDSLGELRHEIESLKRISNASKRSYGNNIFATDLYTTLMYGPMLKGAVELLQNTKNLSNLQMSQELINVLFPQGILRSKYENELHKRIIESDDLSLLDKIKYLETNFHQGGVESIVALSKFVCTIKDYALVQNLLKDKLDAFLSGSLETTALAGLDFVTSHLASKAELLVQTIHETPAIKKEHTTRAVQAWAEKFFYMSYGIGVHFDESKQVFNVHQFGNGLLGTPAEYIGVMKNMRNETRSALIAKALAETNGLLANPSERQKLATIVEHGLGLQSSFINTLIRGICLTGNRAYLTVPTSQMLAPYLFRSLDTQSLSVDEYQQIASTADRSKTIKVHQNTAHILREGQLSEIMYVNTSQFSDLYSETAQLAASTRDHYLQITAELDRLVAPSDNSSEKHPSLAGTEALIAGAQYMGALTTRMCQLTSQFIPIEDPKVADAMRTSLDRNPGINKLLFFENMLQLAEKDAAVQRFVTEELISIDDFAGGGSLNTTFFCTIKGKDGGQIKAVIKMLNPNVEDHIQQSASTAQRALDYVEQNGNAEDIRMAHIVRGMVDFARQWCLKDIINANYEKIDQKYQQVLAKLGLKRSESLFTHPRLICETAAAGTTINRALADPEIEQETKQRIVQTYVRSFKEHFYDQGLRTESGSAEFIFHSDPSTGNAMVNLAASEQLTIIDRTMPLVFEEADVGIYRYLIEGGSHLVFLTRFVNRMVETSKVRGIANLVTVGNILYEVYSKLRSDKQSPDPINVMHYLTNACQRRGIQIPLEHRLMLRNIGAMKELVSRYDLKFEEI